MGSGFKFSYEKIYLVDENVILFKKKLGFY